MRSKVRRLRALFRRYRIDRQLPPQVRSLILETITLRAEERRARWGAARQAVMGNKSTGEAGAHVARLGNRNLVVAGPLCTSTHELGHLTASRVAEILTAADVDTFVVDRRHDGFEFGVALDQRRAALEALAKSLRGEGWYLRAFGGRESCVMPVSEAASARRAKTARQWIIFKSYSVGEHAVGEEQGTLISFWEIGASGKAERVGTRGHDRYETRSMATVEVVDGRAYPGLTAFPVGANLEHFVGPVDVVLTWVDGSDPEWLKQFRATAEAEGRSVNEIALDPARYRSRDELRYALRSIWAYAGWVRKIWIVTADQFPEWLIEGDRIQIVPHSEILPADALPTFNSHAIETALHRIEGLVEHFIYFNDDVAVARPVRPELFFTSNGLARVFCARARVEGAEDESSLAVDTGALRGRELLAERFGRVASFKLHHAPFSLRRSTMERLELEFGEHIQRTAYSRFRSSSDLSVAASFAPHYSVAVGEGIYDDLATEYVHVESGRLRWHLDRIRLSGNIDTFCINETSSTSTRAAENERMIAEFYEKLFPNPAPWERQPQ